MTKYKVINRFKEKNHGGHVYEVGDVYPKQGERFNKQRAEYLAKYNAEFKKTFLEEIKEVKQTKASKTIQDINKVKVGNGNDSVLNLDGEVKLEVGDAE